MISPSTLQFLYELAFHNHKEWMDANRNNYLAAKGDFEKMVGQIIHRLDEVGISPETLTVKSCIFRLNRDIRFSSNKDPYKTNFGAAFSKGGKKSPFAGYYLHLQPQHSFLAAGMWMPDASILQQIRQEISYSREEWISIVQHPDFIQYCDRVGGEKLKNPPKGYSADHPAIEYLKLKSFTVSIPVEDSFLLEKDAVGNILNRFQVMRPFVDFLNKALD